MPGLTRHPICIFLDPGLKPGLLFGGASILRQFVKRDFYDQTESSMLTVREAVDQAKQHVREFFASENPRDVLLEEVEFVENDSKWLITISFVRNELFPKDRKLNVDKLLGRSFTSELVSKEQSGERRVFKCVHVNGENGNMLKIVSVETGMAA
jgi:hypothetical protein